MKEREASSSGGEGTDRHRRRLVVWFGIAIACGLLIAGALIWQSIRRNMANTTACLENVKKIVLAMHAYHDTLGSFPPAYFADKSGRPLHSWRVLLLPFLGQKSLYEKYRFDEPWDGPHNQALSAQMPVVFRCPADRGDPTNTSYVVVAGAGTVFPGTICRRISDVMDGPRNTILFVEAANSGVNWMEPRDLTYEQALAGINKELNPGVSSPHGGFAIAATVDGSIWLLPENLSRDTLRKLLLCNDGEVIPEIGSPQGSAVELPKGADDVRPSEGTIYK